VGNKLEALTNIATVITCAVICVVLLARTGTSDDRRGEDPSYKLGETVDIKNVDYSLAPKTLVMFVRSNCRFCTNSMELYRKIIESPAHRNGQFRVVAITPEESEVTAEYLSSHEVVVDGVVSVGQTETRFSGTPTLLVVDKRGKITGSMRGQLPEKQARELLRILGIEAN
jgi:thioredoxin-related protein